MQVQIIGENSQRLPRYAHNGHTFVEAPPEGAYQIRLYNDSRARKLAVVSVDGINVLSGKDAGHNGPGYVLAPWETIHIKGWSRGKRKAAAFEFTTQGGSYAALTGRGTRNVGVIGVAVFDEREKPSYRHQSIKSRPSKGFPSYWANQSGTCRSIPPEEVVCSTAPTTRSLSKGPAQDVGTAYGSEVDFRTKTVEFDRAARPANILVLRYGVRERLIEWGVPLDQSGLSADPFPASQGVPPPPGWEG